MQNRQVVDFIAEVELLSTAVAEFWPEIRASLLGKVTAYKKNDLRFTLTSGAEISF